MVQEFLEKLLEGVEFELKKAIDRLRKHYPRHHRFRQQVRQDLTIFIDNQTFIIMANVNLKPGKRYTPSPTLTDAVTNLPVAGATFVAKSNTLDSNAFATIDADGKVAYVAPGQSTLTSVNTWTYEDGNTGENVVVDKTTVKTITSLAKAEVVNQDVSLEGEEDIPATV